MAEPEFPDPVKLFVAVLWSDAEALARAAEALAARWGEIDFVGADRVFDVTDYYQPEMGGSLERRLLTFARLVPPETLCEAKLATNKIEYELYGDGRRCVNLDVGYLDHNKIVLASAKEAGQKIYLGEGIYADLVARYKGGRYQPFEWTFPDFKDGRYDDELAEIRHRYLAQLRADKDGAEISRDLAPGAEKE